MLPTETHFQQSMKSTAWPRGIGGWLKIPKSTNVHHHHHRILEKTLETFQVPINRGMGKSVYC